MKMPGRAENGREVSSRLDKAWKLVIRALPADSPARSVGERLKSRLEDDRAEAADLNEKFFKFRDRCNAVLSKNLECEVEITFSESSKGIRLEEHLWDTHSHVNGWYRRQFEIFKHGKKKHVVEHRKVLKRYLEFVKSSQHFYRAHIAQLAAKAEGIPELEAVAEQVTLEDVKLVPSVGFIFEQRSAVLTSCFDALIHLGDLSRWREQVRTEGDANFGPAVGFYDLAATLRPESGKPHHQLAVIAALSPKPEDLRIVYHFYRSLCTLDPHPKAEENLEQQFQRIMSRLEGPSRPPPGRRLEEQEIVTDLINWFMKLHAQCRKGPVYDEYAELELRVMGYLQTNVLEIQMASVLKKMTLVNLAAEWIAKKTMEKHPGEVNLIVARHYFLKLNVKTMDVLLCILQGELNRGQSPTRQRAPAAPKAEDKVTSAMRRVLPSLINYSSWLQLSAEVFPTVLGEGDFHAAFSHDVNTLWRNYCAVLTKLVNTFDMRQSPEIEYMLDEDEETIGFRPFQDHRLRDRYIAGEHRKPDSASVQRHHPMTEMLARIRRLVLDGKQLSLVRTVPIAMMPTGNGRLAFAMHGIDRQPDLPTLYRPTPPPASIGPPLPPGFLAMPPPGFTGFVRRTPSDARSETHYTSMVRSIVGDERHASPAAGPSAGPSASPSSQGQPEQFFLYPSRTRTPPSHTFEDPVFDVDPFRPPATREANRERAQVMELGLRSFHEEAVAVFEEQAAWMRETICQAEEPIIPQNHYGYQSRSGQP